jgi:SAM-dependent methyltransferase
VTDRDYEVYLIDEWQKFAREPERWKASLDATAHTHVSRVLDVGCGCGQELLPFVSQGAFGVGVDLSTDTGALGRRLFAGERRPGRVAFLRSAAEALPFPSSGFDVVISRLALPYTDNRRAIAEIGRVVRPGGAVLLKVHHAMFYVNKFWRGLLERQLLSCVHAARVLASGALYHVVGRQIRNRIVTGETFQSKWLLKKELARCGLVVSREMPDTNAMTPSFLIRRP